MSATMRRLPKDGILLHGLGPSFSRDRMDAAVRSVSGELAAPVLDVMTVRYPEWRIGNPDVPVSISANPAAPWSEICVSILDSHLERYGAEWIVKLFAGLSIACNVVLSRTTAWGGVGFVREQELTGQLEFVDWFQYWATPIVDRWGMAFLTAGPFHRVEAHPDGCTLLLTAEPDDERMSRKSAAEYLGVRLRPVFGRLETGAPFQIPWRSGGAARQPSDGCERASKAPEREGTLSVTLAQGVRPHRPFHDRQTVAPARRHLVRHAAQVPVPATAARSRHDVLRLREAPR